MNDQNFCGKSERRDSHTSTRGRTRGSLWTLRISTTQKSLEVDILLTNQDFVQIVVKPASEVNQGDYQLLKGIDLSGSALPAYLVNDNYVPDHVSEKTHSDDPNSENAPGNDYGDTPNSSSEERDRDSDDEEVPQFEGPHSEKLKKLFKILGNDKKSKRKSSSDEEDGAEDEESSEEEEEDWTTSKRKKKKKVVYNTNHDMWYNND